MTETLIVGCGQKPKPGCWNMDKVAPEEVLAGKCGWERDAKMSNLWKSESKDAWFVLFDLDRDSFEHWFADGRFLRIEAEDVLEHVEDPIRVVQELGRILAKGGCLWIRGPSCNHPEIVWADLTHRRAFAPRTFDGFDPETWDGRMYGHYHGPIKFKVDNVQEVNRGFEYTLTRR